MAFRQHYPTSQDPDSDSQSETSDTQTSQRHEHGQPVNRPRISSGRRPSQSATGRPLQGHNLDSARPVLQTPRHPATYASPANTPSMTSNQLTPTSRDTAGRPQQTYETGSGRSSIQASQRRPSIHGPSTNNSRISSTQPSQSSSDRRQQGPDTDSLRGNVQTFHHTHGLPSTNTSPTTPSQPTPAFRETNRPSQIYDTGSTTTNAQTPQRRPSVHGSPVTRTPSGHPSSQGASSHPHQDPDPNFRRSNIQPPYHTYSQGPPSANESSMASDQFIPAFRDTSRRSQQAYDTGSASTDTHAPYFQGSPASGSRMASSQAASQSAGIRAQQSSNSDFGRPTSQTVYRTAGYGSPSVNASSAASDEVPPASRDTSSRLQQNYDTGSSTTKTQPSHPPADRPPMNSSRNASGQPPSQRTSNRSQHGPGLDLARPDVQPSVTISPMASEQPTPASRYPYSRPSVNNPSMASNQTIPAYRDSSSRSQHPYDTGPATTTTQPTNQPSVQGPPVSGSRIASSQAPSQGTGGRPLQGSNLDSARTDNHASYQLSGPGQMDSARIASSHSQSTGHRPQQGPDPDYKLITKTPHPTAYGPPTVSNSPVALGQPSAFSVASNPTASTSRDPGSRSQQGHGLGPTTSTGQPIYPSSPSGSSANNLPTRATDSEQTCDMRSTMSTGPNPHFPPAPGPSTSNPLDLQASKGTGRQLLRNTQTIPSGPEQPVDRTSTQPLGGNELTGKVKILTFPGAIYQWTIGTGSFTDVFKGEVAAGTFGDNPAFFVAVKLFRAAAGEDKEVTKATSRRFIRESNVWLRLKHPNIQPYLGHCSGLGPSLALISPLCERGSIGKYLTKKPSANKLPLVNDVANGLEYLHSKGVIHADLHCKNILIDNEEHALLSDFGRARVIGEAGYSTALIAGSAPFMAPELFPSNEHVQVDKLFSTQSDVYAFAMVCFEIFTGKMPFASYGALIQDWKIVPLICSGKRPQRTPEVQALISPNIWMIMEGCWNQQPDERISAEVIVQRIDSLVS